MEESQQSVEEGMPEEPRRKPWPLMAAVILVTLLAVWLVPDKELPPSEPVAAVQPAATERPQLQLPTEPTSAGKPVASDRPGDAARRLISELNGGEDTAPRAFEAAQRFSASGRDSDAYLLYFYAARNGHAEAALTLGRQSDPTADAGTASFPSPDLEQAHKWYSLAKASGSNEAGEQLGAFRGRVEQIAANGDPKAQRLMLQWR